MAEERENHKDKQKNRRQETKYVREMRHTDKQIFIQTKERNLRKIYSKKMTNIQKNKQTDRKWKSQKHCLKKMTNIQTNSRTEERNLSKIC